MNKNNPLIIITISIVALSLASIVTLGIIGFVTKQDILGNIFTTLTSSNISDTATKPTSFLRKNTPQPNEPTSSTAPQTDPDPTPALPSPTPTPTPTGPGPYACSPQGVCGNYLGVDQINGCPRTYADPACLKQCSDETKRCKI